MSAEERDFGAAMKAVLSCAHTGAALVKAAAARDTVVAAMQAYCRRLGVDLAALQKRVVHVAGTKGKGSTCVFTEAILRQHGIRTGLFTSPHLVNIRERIRLDGVPIPEDKYLKYFWTVWDTLHATADEAGDYPVVPGFFHVLTLLALYVFQEENVEVVVLEVGMGGRLDSTNVFEEPAATGVTTLDFDHVMVLGNTLPEIAKEKAGIFKAGVQAFSVPQPPDAMAVLRDTATSVGALPLREIRPTLAARMPSGAEPTLGLRGAFQLTNAAMAVALCDTFFATETGKAAVTRHGVSPPPPTAPLSDLYLTALANARFGGRAQIVRGTAPGPAAPSATDAPPPGPSLPADDPASITTTERFGTNVTLYFDGAHTERSMRLCVSWFRAQTRKRGAVPVLLFNCGHEKDSLELLVPLSTVPWHQVVICPFDSSRPSRFQPPSVTTAVSRYFASKQQRDGGNVQLPQLVPVIASPSAAGAGAGTGASAAAAAAAPSATVASAADRPGTPPSRPAVASLPAPSPPRPVTSSTPPLAWQHSLAKLLGETCTSTNFKAVRADDAASTAVAGHVPDPLPDTPPPTHVLPSIDNALTHLLRETAPGPRGTQYSVLVTGSLYLVGNVLAKLQ